VRSWLTVTRDGTNLGVLDYGGDGPSVLLLHGLAGHAREWADTADVLVERHRVIALDARGHGRSQRAPANVSRRAHIDDVAFVIDELDLAPVTLVGHSLGGHTAMLVAAEHPDSVSGLVLADAGPERDSEASVREVSTFLASWPRPFASRDAAEEFFGGASLRAGRWADGLEHRADGLWPAFDAAVLVRTLREAADRAYWDEWQAITCPVLLVVAANGSLGAGEVAEMRARNPSARVVEISRAGHDVHLDNLAAWTDALSGFLDSLTD
jgi:pimeloyl-ACP methyl ester carboxylesterase